jgi:copper homeostasis protein
MALALPSAPPAIVRLEVCVDSVRSARAALAGGAHAVELCSGLVDGGITPSLGLIAAVVGVAAQSSSAAAPAVAAEAKLLATAASASAIPPGINRRLHVNVLIRCRPGDFLYDDDELDVMLHDIRQCGASGADGVVVGALTADGAVDERALRRMIEAAGGMKVRLGLPRRRNPPRNSIHAASNSVFDFN